MTFSGGYIVFVGMVPPWEPIASEVHYHWPIRLTWPQRHPDVSTEWPSLYIASVDSEVFAKGRQN